MPSSESGSLLSKKDAHGDRPLFYGQEESVYGQVHLTGQASAWKEPGITFLGTQERFRTQL